MNTGIKGQVARQTGGLAKHIAQQVAGEPLEVLKTGAMQVAAIETTPAPQKPPAQQLKPTPASQDLQVLNQVDEARSRQLYQNLQDEMKQIRAKEEEKKALRLQKPPDSSQSQTRPATALVEPSLRPSRGILKGMGRKLSDLKRKAEIRMPPSG